MSSSQWKIILFSQTKVTIPSNPLLANRLAKYLEIAGEHNQLIRRKMEGWVIIAYLVDIYEL
jgi:hypothetical protein